MNWMLAAIGSCINPLSHTGASLVKNIWTHLWSKNTQKDVEIQTRPQKNFSVTPDKQHWAGRGDIVSVTVQ